MPRRAKPKRDLARVLDLLWEQAEEGSVTAQKALYDHYRRDEESEAPEGDAWSAIYGEGGNVTPLKRRAS
jgi:hypothetical protein